MSPARIGFNEVSASNEEPPKDIKGSGPRRGEEEVEIAWMMSPDRYWAP